MRYYFLALGALVVVCTGCAGIDTAGSVLSNRENIAPPAEMLHRPGPMVDGPGPGVLGMPMPGSAMACSLPGGAGADYAAVGSLTNTQVTFVGDAILGAHIGWQVGEGFAENQLVVPARYDFQQNAVYQLKLSGIANWDTLSLYPTLEVRAAHPTTLAYLTHNAVPLEITEEDLENVDSSNMVTKVIYLPDPEFQARAIRGVETLVSTTLDPGIDPVEQAEQMGTVMLVLRFGNKDLQPPAAVVGPDGSVTPVSYAVLNGDEGQVAPPMPIRMLQTGMDGIPSAMIAAGGGAPGQPVAPVPGMGAMPPWGMPITGTPIGLPGPPHLPYGRPAGLKSHTIRNLSKNKIPDPTDHLLLDVKHNPGYRYPEPVHHVQYTETHPVLAPGEAAVPVSGGGAGAFGAAGGAFDSNGGAFGAAGGAYCPPGTF